MPFIDFHVEPQVGLGTSANIDISLNGTFDPLSFPGDGNPFIVYGMPDSNFEPALPVREWNAWYGAPGYNVNERVIPDRFVRMPYPSVGMNPWDYTFGGIRADDGLLAIRARFMQSQEGIVSNA